MDGVYVTVLHCKCTEKYLFSASPLWFDGRGVFNNRCPSTGYFQSEFRALIPGRDNCFAYESRKSIIFTNRRDARFGYMELSLFHADAVYIAVINVVTFIVYAVDKWKARRMACGVERPAGIGVHGRPCFPSTTRHSITSSVSRYPSS